MLYDVIMNSNADMLAPLGYFSDHGFRIDKDDPTKSNLDYLGDYPARIRFSHHGRLDEQFGGAFFSHAWSTPRGTFTYGLRAETQNTSGEVFPSPRASYRWKLNGRDELLFHGGLFSQNDLPFYERDQNPGLLSEKAAQAGAQWTRSFAKGFRLSVDAYYKYYYDLVAATLIPNNTIDLKSLLLPLPGSPLSTEEIAQLKSILDTTKNFSALPDSIQQAAYQTFGGLAFRYANTGTGNSLGTEFSFSLFPDHVVERMGLGRLQPVQPQGRGQPALLPLRVPSPRGVQLGERLFHSQRLRAQPHLSLGHGPTVYAVLRNGRHQGHHRSHFRGRAQLGPPFAV